MKPEMVSLVDSVIQSGDRMTHMIEELLDISRLQTGKITPRPRFIDAHQIIAVAMRGVSLQATTKGVTLKNDVPPGMRLFADPELLNEVLQNLLSNGVKFLSAGERVVVSVDPGHSSGLLVEDNGPGIDAAILPNLFRHEVKTSTKGSAGEMGTGLGLPYAHDLMKAMKGELDVESSPDIGARFRVTFPSLRPTVLAVDDEKAARLLMVALLKDLDVDTVTASGGEEALSVLKERRIDCVVTDLNMPDLDGLELLQEIKKNGGAAGPPVMIVTADHSMETRVKIIQAGADDFLTKPVDKNDLIPRLRRFLS